MASTRRHALDIRLPEGVVFSLPLAGPATRFLAWLIDLIFTLIAILIVSVGIGRFLILAPDVAGGCRWC